MAKDNRFFDRTDNSSIQDIDKNALLLKILQSEFPDDYLLQRGQLEHDAEKETEELIAAPKPIAKALRSPDGIMRMSADKSEYVEITAMKSVPTVDEDELDEILDEEYEFFLDPDEPPAPLPVTGEFFMKPLSPLKPTDFHDLYIRFGPATIGERVGTTDEIIDETFCVFFIQNNVALPIPNYKTLEVMLVERGLTYSDINEASPEDVLLYDMELDGNFAGDPTSDLPADPVEEFNYRRMDDRSQQWSELIRFQSGYEPGAPFKRDPGDYLKPTKLGRLPAEERAERGDLYIDEDPDDFYYDRVFQGQTYKEKLREKYEGKMIIAKWPTDPDFSTNITSNFSLVRFDDLSYNLRMMTLGYWKQVVDVDTMAIYASINDIDLSGKRNISTDGTEAVIDQFIEEQGALNQLIVNNGVTVLQEEVEDADDVPIWNDFPHIAEADALDRLEYIDYIDNFANPFDIEHLKPYEPVGSIKYYNQVRVLELQEQAVLQARLTEIKEALKELALTTGPKIVELTQILAVSDDISEGFVEDQLGIDADIYKILESNSNFRWRKRKNNGKIKNKKEAVNFIRVAGKQRVYNKLSNNARDNAERHSQLLGKNFYLNDRGNDKQRDAEIIPPIIKSNPDSNFKVAHTYDDLKARAKTTANDLSFANRRLAELNDLYGDVDEILTTSTDPEAVVNVYDALVELLDDLSRVDDIVTEASDIKADVAKVRRQYVKKCYDFVQTFRRAVYEDNNKYFIQWSDKARNLINAEIPGKNFTDFLPDGVE